MFAMAKRVAFLVVAVGLLGACSDFSLGSLNPFSPDSEDLQPLFPEAVPNQTWTVGTAIHVSLPAATLGNPPLTYGLSPELPAGLTFDAAARTIAGTPTAVQSMTTYIYSATDDDDDTASIQFQGSVVAASGA